MPSKVFYCFVSLLGIATVFCAGGARAQQYVYGAEGPSGGLQDRSYPSPSNNYVSVPGSTPFQNPYQMPAATATSYKPVYVPGGSQYQPVYVPGNSQYQDVAPVPSSSVAVPVTPPPPASSYVPEPQPALAPRSSYDGTPEYQTAQAAPDAGQLPSYPYDPNLDPRQVPVYRPPAAQNQPGNSSSQYSSPYMGLQTRSGIELGGQFFYYSYAEPSLSVSETGELLGLTARGTMAFGNGFFTTADISYQFGDVDYSGSGSADGDGLDSWDLRGLFGKDFTVSREISLSPYIGLGYRTLFNDARGISSSGASGYRRYNQLYYIPVGVYPRTHIDSDSRLTGTLEYDYVAHGLQTSYFSDSNFGDPNVKTAQSSGYGIRGDVMYETHTWSFGPFFTYWSIDQSATKLAQDNSPTSCAGVGGPPCLLIADEPANHTFEVGVQFRYHFF